jgi:hypothetical protein
MLNTLWVIGAILIAVLIYLTTCAEFEAIKKHYPDMTFIEYILIGDKIRITPEK